MADETMTEAPAKKRSKRKSLIGGVAAFFALLALAFVVLNSSIGKRFVADEIAAVAPASGLRFEVGRIDGDLFGEATLNDVTLYDIKGEFLTIPVVELDWNPLVWLTSGLDVNKLVARRGTLLRVPELEPGDPDAPVLPDFDIKIGRFEIDQLTIAPGIVGETSPVVDLIAEADIRDGRVFVKAEGDLGEQDRLLALIDAEPDGDKFDIDLDYRAPAGGVLAGLIGVQEGYTARIKGDGTWSRWTGYSLVKRGVDRVVAFKISNSSGTYNLLGQAAHNGLLTGIPARALGETVSLGATGTLEASIFDGVINLIGNGIRGRGEGSVNLAGNAFDNFAVNARVTDPGLLGQSVSLEGAALTATLDGPFRDLTIDHRLSVNEAMSGETRLTGVMQEGTATFDGTRWVLPLDARVAQVETGTAMIDPKLLGGRLSGSLTLSGSRLLSDDLRLVFPDATANLALRGDLGAGSYQLTGPVDVRGLTLENIGSVSGNAKVDLQFRDTGIWAVKTAFSARIPQVTNDTLANIAGNAITANGAVSIGSNSPLDFRNVTVNAEKLKLNLNGKVAQSTTSLAGNGTHTQYGDFTVEASLNDNGPTANLLFANPLPAAGMRDVRVAISPTENGFDILTNGQSTLGEFDGALAFVSPEVGPTYIDIKSLDVWKTSITGQLRLNDGGADGSLRLDGGGLNGKIGLAARNGGQGFAFDIDASRAQFGGNTPISVARAEIDGRGFLKEGTSTFNAEMAGEGLTYGTLFIGRFAARSELENGKGFANAAISGRRGSRFALQVNAGIEPKRIAVAARGKFAGKDIRMPRRAVVSKQDDGGWQLARTMIQYGNGGMLMSGEFGGGRTAMNLAMDDMPLSLIDLAVADMGVGGSISGRVDFETNRFGVPVGNARIVVDDLTRSGLVLSSRPIDLSLVTRLTPDKLELRAVLDEDGDRRGRVQARIVDLPSSGALTDRLRAGDLFGQLRFEGPASSLWRLAAIEAFDLTGPVSVALNATGTLADPSVRGSLASDDLRLRSALSGTDIRGVSARGSFAGSRLQLSRFSGSTANGGSVSGSGYIDLEDVGPKGPEIDIRVSAKNARLLNANGLNATITGPLRIKSSGVGGTIAGRVEVDRASWQLGTAADDMTLPQITTREINVPADIAAPRQRFQPWRYLIDARARSRVEVDGMGLDSEWRADIKLRGTTSDPRIGGQARVVRGFYSFAGTRFELTRGRINFDVNVPIDPRVDIIAETDQNGLDVAVSVKGNALTPEIMFSSVPALPEEEILARLLFGGSITELSATDALQLGTALASLRGGSGLDPINKLRTAIGLDRLRIVGADPALGRGTGVAVGKNIGRRFYVEIITDGRGYSATEAEFRVTSWLSLLANVSTIGRESASVEISRDY